MNVINKSPFIQTSRKFPNDELSELAFQINLAYVDIANAVNKRTISLYSSERPSITGESWFITNNSSQSSFRQVYPFTTLPASIPHNIDISSINRFSLLYGSFTDGANWYGVIAGSNVAVAGQISFYITTTNIVFLTGAGAPVPTMGTVVLEWLSQP